MIEEKAGCYILIDNNRCKDDKIFFKIGQSSNVKRRIKQIKASYNFNGMNNDGLEIFNIIYCNKPKLLEKELHLSLACYRIKGEYFFCTMDKLNERLMMLDIRRYK